MTAIQITEILHSLYPEEGGPQFEVVFSGHRNKRVHGTYSPDTQVIKLNDGNFAEGGDMLYTAIHELAHHVMCVKYGSAGRGHPSLFWATFHDLLTLAEKKKKWKPSDVTPVQAEIIAVIKNKLQHITQLEIELGEQLNSLHGAVAAEGGRIEDYIDRHLLLGRTTSKLYQKVWLHATAKAPPDAAHIIARATKPEAAEMALASGKSLDQAKQQLKGNERRITALPMLDNIKERVRNLKQVYAKTTTAVATAKSRELAVAVEIKELEEALNVR